MSQHGIRDSVRINLLEFTQQAFKMIPPIENPSILDIGCGTGIQSIELAKMSNGHITAIDIDIPALVFLQRKIKEQGLSHRFSIKQVSMNDLHHLGESYDIIWAEGSIYAVGFEKGIRDWKQILKKNGYLVIHDEDDRIETKLKIIEKYGYKLIGQIDVSHEEWESRYYKPLIGILSTKKISDAESTQFRKELDTFKRTKMGSVFFILQNKS
ncbi:MAG: class I SAM-dependent methyltransferase [Candidatus Thorarchaeota archaeon]